MGVYEEVKQALQDIVALLIQNCNKTFQDVIFQRFLISLKLPPFINFQ